MGMYQDWVWLKGRSWGMFLLLVTEWGIKEQSCYEIEGGRCSGVALLLESMWLQSGLEKVAVIKQQVVLQGWSLSEVPL